MKIEFTFTFTKTNEALTLSIILHDWIILWSINKLKSHEYDSGHFKNQLTLYCPWEWS